jgi:hypothetical protein
MATKIARKKFQEALKALKQACKNERLPFALRIRSAELICAIYGLPLPESSTRVKRAVKELVAEGQFDRQIREQVQTKTTQDAVASARAFLESVKGKQ